MADPVTEQIGARADWQRGQETPAELAAAAQRSVEDAAGNRIPFGSLYKERKTIVIFLRHFLCYVCKEYVEDLGKIPKKVLQDANVRLVVIGQSAHYHIQPFCNLTGYPHEIYVDPRREIYKILGMKRGESSSSAGDEIHFVHLDQNRLDHIPINNVLQLAGVETVDFTCRYRIVDV
ncbi:peroxiredoxin-like 2C isoform X2 [Erythrolamprus reginae]|uniref:peroxiredoxin-like 2C isoform X2 n=1 Tax=Erythrolamprus reginae TaxID=121349 RepID=UPI00396CD8F4